LRLARRECLEETAHPFKPHHLVGVYQSRFHRAAKNGKPSEEITYVRFAFSGDIFKPHRSASFRRWDCSCFVDELGRSSG
jgi:8-oxo-dGTP pyrophosphatase MutT (NUDIX family)